MAEHKFFSDGNVTVTNARFVVEDQTFAMSGITSVAAFKEERKLGAPIALGFIGLVILLSNVAGQSGGAVALGALLIGIASYVGWQSKPAHGVMLRTASGEVRALTSKDPAFISRVIKALNEAIVARS